MAHDQKNRIAESDAESIIASIKQEVAREMREDGQAKSRVRAGNRPFVIQSSSGNRTVGGSAAYRRDTLKSSDFSHQDTPAPVAQPRTPLQDDRLRRIPTTSSARAGGTDTFLNAVARQSGQALGTSTPAYQVDNQTVMTAPSAIDYKSMRPSWFLRGFMFWLITLVGFGGAGAIYWRYWMANPPTSPFEAGRPELLVALFGGYAGCGIIAGFILGIIMRFSAKRKGDVEPGSWIVSGIGRGALAVCLGALAIVAMCILADMNAHHRLPW